MPLFSLSRTPKQTNTTISNTTNITTTTSPIKTLTNSTHKYARQLTVIPEQINDGMEELQNDDEDDDQTNSRLLDEEINNESFEHYNTITYISNSTTTTNTSTPIKCAEINAKSAKLINADDKTAVQKYTTTTTVATKPSNTSKNFENTFKLLQNHLDVSYEKGQSILEQSSIDTDGEAYASLSSFVQRTTNTTALSNEELPTRLELEIEAMQRIRKILAELKTEEGSETTPLLALYHDFVSKGLTEEDVPTNDKLNATVLENANNAGLIYHAAKSMDGKNCLRVVRNLLNDKVLCGNRVSQMTRAYDDIEAVTRLLEEKEKDLELTVQIGKELLTQNNALEARITDLEADLKASNDDRAQLVHELHKKNELIAVLTNDADDGTDTETPTFSKSITLDLMQKKIVSLQDENKSLRSEASILASKTDEVEEHERQLMADISAQLNDANSQFDYLNLDLERQREENRLQHEQIVSLTARLAETEMRLHQLTHDNDEHLSLLNITKENQNALALELVEFKQRYEEVLALLREAQDQLKQQRKKIQPQARSSFLGSIGAASGVGAFGGMGVVGGMLQPESLQSELMESSMYSENSLDSGISGDNQRSADRISRLMSQLPGGVMGASAIGGVSGGMGLGAVGIGGTMAGGSAAVPPYKRIFDTVRCASKHGNYADSGNVSMSQLGAMSMSSASGPRMSSMAYPAGSYYRGGDSSNSLCVKTLSSESLNSASDDGYPAQPSGVPGAPGAKELEAALKRLTPAEVLARRAMLSYAPAGTYNYDEPTQTTLPVGIRTPDSIMSTGSSGMSSSAHLSASMSHQWRLPEKLQIVKPMEGSQTLHHWSRLATPTLGGLLDDRPGVTIRGGRDLGDLGMQVYTLSDVEEDVCDDLPGKQFEAPGCTFTYTTSMVMHPDDGFVNDMSFLSQSQMSSRMASTSTSRQPSCPPTPRAGLSRKNSCSTFSVNLGLASMLNERGIKAVTPSALNTPAGPNYSPTVTPCNSPEGSPPRSQSPEPLFGLLTSGADLIRRKLVGGEIERPNRNLQQMKQQKIMLSRLERRALRSLKLVEKVESIGLENIIAAQQHNTASGIANRSSSPLASQLGSMKHLHLSSNSIVDDIHFDRAQIKGVLHKGLNTSSPAPSVMSSSTSAYNSDSGDEQFASGISDDQGIMMKPKTPQTETTPKAAATSKPPIPKVATTQNTSHSVTSAAAVTGATTTTNSATETRIKQMQRQKSRRNLKNGMAAQRPDLGSVGGAGVSGRVRPDLGKVGPTAAATAVAKTSKSGSDNKQIEDAKSAAQQQSITQSFVGSVSSLLFGRKGGWL